MWTVRGFRQYDTCKLISAERDRMTRVLLRCQESLAYDSYAVGGCLVPRSASLQA